MTDPIEIKIGQLWRSPANQICRVVSVDNWGILLTWPDGSSGRPYRHLFNNQKGGYRLEKCEHDRLNEDGICRSCGEDRRDNCGSCVNCDE